MVTDKMLKLSYQYQQQCLYNIKLFVGAAVKDIKHVSPKDVSQISEIEGFIHQSLVTCFKNITRRK